MEIIRHVKNIDKNFWFKLDKHLSEAEFKNKVRDKTGYVLLEGDIPIGILRYGLFWDSIPFCTMIYIVEKYQRHGFRKKLMLFWENEMKLTNNSIIMTSSRSDESAQHFYRKLGYRDCGNLIIDISKFKQPSEIFFIKEI